MSSDVELSPAGQVGQDVFERVGCSSCHGEDGSGGVGPVLFGLYGSQETLASGESVLVDVPYLERAITDPDADRVEGYTIKMPLVGLSDIELASIITYLQELQ